jgi:phenylacetate-CoA ligase
MSGFMQRLKTKTPRDYVVALNPWWWVKRARRIESARRRMHEVTQEIYPLLSEVHEGKTERALLYQNTHFAEIIRYAAVHCPYYRRAFSGLALNDISLSFLSELEFTDKSIVRENMEQMLSDELHQLPRYVCRTGGSTGIPMRFPVSSTLSLVDQTHQQFFFDQAGYVPGDVIVAFDGTTIPEELVKQCKYWQSKSSNDIPFGRMAFSTKYLNDNTVDYYLQQLRVVRPAFIRGYPTAINTIAEYILAEQIVLPFEVKAVQLTSETITPRHIENIRRAFHTTIYLQYGHIEAAVCCNTRDETYMYWNSPLYGIIEILAPNGKHVSPGEVGDVVATGLHSKALPFIRYRTGDVAEYEGASQGIVILKKVIGRDIQYIYTKDMKKKLGLGGLESDRAIDALRRVSRWQVQQDVPGEIIFRIVVKHGFADHEICVIREMLEEAFCVVAQVEVVDSIPLTERGKWCVMIQKVKDRLTTA